MSGSEQGGKVVVEEEEDEERASLMPRMTGPASRPVLQVLGTLRDTISWQCSHA